MTTTPNEPVQDPDIDPRVTPSDDPSDDPSAPEQEEVADDEEPGQMPDHDTEIGA